ncbi:MAG: hypothetical protein A2Y56_07945 [Candidatus Aminicenantes bacterium RBG_13_63_10]|nr:MAG: hypothetical protein A2Y56_07945 [Candidatus Aminicenantes bacterium RBG_13_63_10]
MNDILKLENISKGFGRKKVLRGLDLSLDKGRVCGLLGRNGEGKTTLIRILMGIIPADAGRIVYQGRPVAFADAAYKRTIGYIAEDNIFYDRMTVRGLLRFNASFFPSWSRQKAEDYLNRFGLPGRDRIRTLSRGQKLKLGLVAALAASPELLLLDDPTSGLDVPTRHDFLRNIIHEITEAGTTVLFASHMVHELEKVIDRLAILHGGRLVLDVDYEDLRSKIKKVAWTGRAAEWDKSRINGIVSAGDTADGCELIIYPWDEAVENALTAAGPGPLETSVPSLEEIFTSFVG